MAQQRAETSDLVKTLLSTEKECRDLRAEVAVLERSLRFRNRDALAITSNTLESSDVSMGRKPRSIPIPIDAVGEMTTKAGEVTLLLKESKRLLREREQLEVILSNITADIAEAEDENMKLKEVVGCADNDSIAHVKNAVDMAAQANALKHDIINDLNDRDTVHAVLKRQTGYLKEISSELTATENLEELVETTSQQLAEKRAELESIRREVVAMQHLLGRKENMLENKKPVDVLALALSAETDRRVALHKLEKQQEAVRHNDVSIRHRAIQIAKLEKRIEMIGDAFARDEESQGERVDAEALESVRKEIISLTLRHQEAAAGLDLLDHDIAQLDRRANGLVHATSNVQRETHRIEKEHRKFTNAQEREIQIEQDETEHEIREIEREIEMLRNVTMQKMDKTVDSSQ